MRPQKKLDLIALIAAVGAAVVLARSWAVDRQGALLALGVAALALLAAYGIRANARISAFRRRRTAADIPTRAGAGFPFELERVAHFGESLIEAVVQGTLRQVLNQTLPGLLGTSQVWLLTEDNGWRNVIIGNDAPDLLGTARSARWESFALVSADRKRIGLLGLRQAGGISEEQRRLVELLCGLIATALTSAREFADIRELSTIDPLSGCLLRHAAINRLAAELRRANRSGHPLTVVVLAVDDLVAIEPTAERNAARLVVRLGTLLQETVRVSDIRCRIAPGHFLLVLPDTTAEGGRRAVEHLTAQLQGRDTGGDGSRPLSAVRAGVAQAGTHETDPEVLIERALKCLERPEASKRPAHTERSPAPPPAATKSEGLFSDARRAGPPGERSRVGGRRSTD